MKSWLMMDKMVSFFKGAKTCTGFDKHSSSDGSGRFLLVFGSAVVVGRLYLRIAFAFLHPSFILLSVVFFGKALVGKEIWWKDFFDLPTNPVVQIASQECSLYPGFQLYPHWSKNMFLAKIAAAILYFNLCTDILAYMQAKIWFLFETESSCPFIEHAQPLLHGDGRRS